MRGFKMTAFVALMASTTMAVAEDVEVLHWWTSGGEAAALGGHNRIPAFFGGNRIQIGQCLFGSPILNIKAQHLHRGGRIA